MTRTLSLKLLLIAAGAYSLFLLAASCSPAEAEADTTPTIFQLSKERAPYGVLMFRDPGTGCEYLVLSGSGSPHRALTPRMTNTGHHKCKK